MYKVFFDNLLVEDIKSEEKIVIAGEKIHRAKVLAVGNGGEYDMQFKVGDIVYYNEFDANKFKNYWVLEQKFILAQD
jgi:co-chaperonin GroES (HSP10)